MSSKIKIVRHLKDLRKAVGSWRTAGERVALVPTMGALHDGHLALVGVARKKAGRTVVSIFVNPTQFAPTEDLSRYPRDEAGDLTKLQAAGADLVWSPTAEEMYPEGFSTRIVPGSAAEDLEGEFRPHHFGGVATVCCKLFSQVTPDVAVFGEKDYQQLCVVRQMVRDLNLPLTIAALPTQRAKDGLALSSRNAYLTPDERSIAPALHRALLGIADVAKTGGPVNRAIETANHDLLAAGFARIDYIEIRDAETLEPYEPRSGREGRVLAAVWLGRTRLIDNVGVGS